MGETSELKRVAQQASKQYKEARKRLKDAVKESEKSRQTQTEQQHRQG